MSSILTKPPLLRTILSAYFGPLKKKAKEEIKIQDLKWAESLFWQLADITKEAQEELGVNGGILADFQPHDQRPPKTARLVNRLFINSLTQRQPPRSGYIKSSTAEK